jgi:hypothetical protein
MIETSAGYAGHERRASVGVTREEFEKFAKCSVENRIAYNARLDRHGEKLDALQDDNIRHNKILNRLSDAIFAKDSHNENGQPGLMVTARNIDNHITAICNIARFIKWLVLGICGLALPVLGVLNALGILKI